VLHWWIHNRRATLSDALMPSPGSINQPVFSKKEKQLMFAGKREDVMRPLMPLDFYLLVFLTLCFGGFIYYFLFIFA
jgi:hypothetical protein